ncbi:MAG: Mov34/MPN/PAD-1 family protein [Planctomycetes bacterium]|nr:Mov34/MPN/PAD-1 family protein [Planctomycetota bacterium]
MAPFLFRQFPELLQCGAFPFDPEFPFGLPPYDLFSPDDELPDDNPRIPHASTSDQKCDDPPKVATWSRPLPSIRMLQAPYLDIMRHLASVPHEAGGALIGLKGSPVVTHYVPDKNGKATAASFTLDAAGLNRVLKRMLECGLDCKGLVHSHPPGCGQPSSGDLAYVRKSFANEKNKDLKEFLLPIFCDGILIPYVVRPHEQRVVQAAQLILF